MLILFVTLYLVIGIWMIKRAAQPLNFSVTFYVLSTFFALVSPLTSYVARDKYIVPGWRHLNDDAWLWSRLDGIVLPYLLLSMGLFILFYLYESALLRPLLAKSALRRARVAPAPGVSISSGRLLAILLLVFAVNFVLFELGLGITGVETASPYRISGGVYYLRLIIAPLLVYFLCRRVQATWLNQATMALLVYILAVSQASRLIAGLGCLMLFLAWGLKRGAMLKWAIVLQGFLIFGLVTLGRGNLYDGDGNDFLKVLAFPFTHDLGFGPLHWEFFVDAIDTTLSRLGGFHEMFHVDQMINYGQSCASFDNFVASGRVCDNVGYDVFGLDLGSLKFGMNLSLVTQAIMLFSLPNGVLAAVLFLMTFCAVAMLALRLCAGNSDYHRFFFIFLSMNFFLGHLFISTMLLVLAAAVALFRRVVARPSSVPASDQFNSKNAI